MPDYRPLRAGDLRHRVEMQEMQQTGLDKYRQPVEDWVTIATVWAAVEPISGREYFAAAQVQSEVTHRVRIRYRSGVTAKHRIKFGARLFDIQAVLDPGERHQELQIMAKEVGV